MTNFFIRFSSHNYNIASCKFPKLLLFTFYLPRNFSISTNYIIFRTSNYQSNHPFYFPFNKFKVVYFLHIVFANIIIQIQSSIIIARAIYAK